MKPDLLSPVPPDPAALPRYTSYAATYIDAPPAAVWAAITDFASYGEWNTLCSAITPVDATLGDEIMLTVHLREGQTRYQKEYISYYDPPHAIAWSPVFPAWVLSAARFQLLEPSDGGTSYTTWEIFRGVLAPVLSISGILRDVQRGLTGNAADLKRYVEVIRVEK